jgi:histidinol-phosphatase (PHP family)
MNSGAISRGYRKTPYPAPFLLKEIKERGGKIILSSDSHRATDLTCAFDECIQILRASGICSVVSFKNGKFEEFGI